VNDFAEWIPASVGKKELRILRSAWCPESLVLDFEVKMWAATVTFNANISDVLSERDLVTLLDIALLDMGVDGVPLAMTNDGRELAEARTPDAHTDNDSIGGGKDRVANWRSNVDALMPT